MADFVAITAVILTLLSVGVFAAIIGLVLWDLALSVAKRRKRKAREVLPPPDKAAERTYGQQYFHRAVSKD